MIKDFNSFIEKTLFTRVGTKKMEIPKSLPSYFENEYEVYSGSINSIKCLVIVSYLEQEKFKQLNKRMLMLSNALENEKPVVFVSEYLSWYMINKLIENGISFVIPGSQIHLPFLACSLNVNIEPIGITRKTFSPAAQYIFIELITMNKEKFELSDFEGTNLSKMSVSRSFKELVDFELVKKCKVNNRVFWVLEMNKRKLWKQSRKYLFNPVMRTISIELDEINYSENLIAAGESALADMSLMSMPNREVLAISSTNFRNSKNHYLNLSVNDANCLDLQLWKHPIPIYAGKIHPLALYTSFIGSYDDRINECLDDLIDNFWRAMIWYAD